MQEETNTEKNNAHPKLSNDCFHYDGVERYQYKAMRARHGNGIYCTVSVWHGEPLQERVGIPRSNQRRHLGSVVEKYRVDARLFKYRSSYQVGLK